MILETYRLATNKNVIHVNDIKPESNILILVLENGNPIGQIVYINKCWTLLQDLDTQNTEISCNSAKEISIDNLNACINKVRFSTPYIDCLLNSINNIFDNVTFEVIKYNI